MSLEFYKMKRTFLNQSDLTDLTENSWEADNSAKEMG